MYIIIIIKREKDHCEDVPPLLMSLALCCVKFFSCFQVQNKDIHIRKLEKDLQEMAVNQDTLLEEKK